MKFIILLIASLTLNFPALQSQGWVFSEGIYNKGSILDIHFKNDTLTSLLVAQTKTTLEQSHDGGDNWTTLAEYNSDFDPLPWDMRFLNPSILRYLPDNDQYWLAGFTPNLAFLIADKDVPTFEKLNIDKGPQVVEFDMYDSLTGYASSTATYYLTKDRWETIDSIQKGDNPVRRVKDVNFLNDSIIETIIYNNEADKDYFTHLNINTFEWDTLGSLTEHIIGFREYEKVNEHLIYGLAGEPNGVGAQGLDVIYRSRDGGKNWELQLRSNENPVFGLYKISFNDEVNGIAIGNYGKVVMTNNGGEEWVDFDYEDQYPVPSGPVGVELAWYKDKPIITGLNGELYRYEGNFFRPNYNKAKKVELWNPEEDENRGGNSVNFSWERLKQSEYDYYHLQITDNQEYNRWLRPYKEVKIDGNTSTLYGFDNNRKYYWRVVTVDGSKTAISEERSFTIGNAGNPGDKVPLLLAECDSVYNKTDTLRWTSIEGADRYRVQYVLPGDSVTNDFTTIDTFSVIGSKVFDGMYHNFRIKSYTENDSSLWSPYCRLWIRLDPPTIPMEYCEQTNVDFFDTLSWDLAYKGTFNTVRITRDKEGTDSVLQVTPERKWLSLFYSHIRKKLEPSTTYYWSVRNFPVHTERTVSNWSETCSFTTSSTLSSIEPNNDITIINTDGIIEVLSDTHIYSLSLVDVSGRQVVSSGSNLIKTEGLHKGIYFLLIDERTIKKVFID